MHSNNLRLLKASSSGDRVSWSCQCRRPELWSSAGCRGQQPLTNPSRVSCTQHRPGQTRTNQELPWAGIHPALRLLGWLYSSRAFHLSTVCSWNTNVHFGFWFYDIAFYISQSQSQKLKLYTVKFACNLCKLLFGQHHLHQDTEGTQKSCLVLCASQSTGNAALPKCNLFSGRFFVKCSRSSIKRKK